LSISRGAEDDNSRQNSDYSDLELNLLADRSFLDIHGCPSRLAHYHGIDCKLSGSVYVVSEIERAIPLIHGVRGCAFHQRLSPRKLYSPVYDMACTNLMEEDVIYGGEEKLRRGIYDTYKRYNPDLIVVLPTCISGLMGEDVHSVVEDIKDEVPCELVIVTSEGFAHRDHDSIDSIMQYVATSWKNTSQQFDFRGCGQVDMLAALAEQLMEEQDVIENSVNLESNGRNTFGFNLELQEVGSILGKMGITLNTVFPTTTVKRIKQAPAARLNIARSRTDKWAAYMKDEFGTDHIKSWPHNSGIEGMARFLMDIGTRMGLDGEAEAVIDEEKKRAEKELVKIRHALMGYSFAIVSQSLIFNPHRARVYIDDLMIPIKCICIDSLVLNRLKVSQETRDMMIKNMYSIFDEMNLDFQITTDPSAQETYKISKEVDHVLGEFITSHVYERNAEIPVLDITMFSNMLYRTSFNVIIELGRYLTRRINRPQIRDRHLIVSRLKYNSPYYPLLDDPRISSSVSMWQEIWRANSRGGC
jgi:nitrogenase molybdenum-iron protein alpha/beta subunit